MLYKDGTPLDLNNYRGIMLLPIEYKLYSAMLSNRASKFLEDNNLLSPTQGGFRPNKSCEGHIYTLMDIFEDAKINDAELHALFIDLKKAFDTFPHWMAGEIFKNYHFPQEFCDIIDSLYKNLSCNIVTDIGQIDNIPILKGTRQGDPLSPLIWILFLDPLLHWLNHNNLGYKINKSNKSLKNLAWCDDLVFLSSDRKDIENQLSKLTKFCEYYGLKINPSKSGYMYRANIEYPTMTVYNEDIKFYNANKPYKYLGIHININLDWTEQIEICNKKLTNFLKFIKFRAITTDQKILATNSIIIPAITHKMPFVDMDHIIPTWDDLILSTIRFSIGLNGKDDNELFWTPKDKGGRGLLRLSALSTAIKINSPLRHAMNSTSQLTYYTTNTRLENSAHNSLINIANHPELQDNLPPNTPSYLTKFINTLKSTTLEWDTSYIDQSSTYHTLHNKSLTYYSLDKLHIYNIKQIIQHNKLINHNNPLFSRDLLWSSSAWYPIRTQYCLPNSDIIDTNKITLLNKQKPLFTKPNQYDDDDYTTLNEKYTLIWVDGSAIQNNNTAGSGVFVAINSPLNKSFRVNNNQTNDEAELEALEYALSIAPPNTQTIIISDSTYTINMATNCTKYTEKDWIRLKNRSTIKRIKNFILSMNAPPVLWHVYSHIEEKLEISNDINKWAEKIDKQKRYYGDLWNLVTRGNSYADILAGEGNYITTNQIRTPEGSDLFFLRDQTGNILEKNIRELILNSLTTTNIQSLHRKEKRGEPYRSPSIHTTLSYLPFTFNDPLLYKTTNFIHKLRQRITPNAALLFHIANSKKIPFEDRSPWDKYLAKIYTNNLCELCNEKDDLTHFMRCNSIPNHDHSTTTDNLLAIINKELTPELRLQQFIWWFHTPTQNHPLIHTVVKDYKEINNFNKEWGTLLFIPKHLPEILHNISIPEDKIDTIIVNIIIQLSTDIHTTYVKHKKAFHKTKNSSQIKKELNIASFSYRFKGYTNVDPLQEEEEDTEDNSTTLVLSS